MCKPRAGLGIWCSLDNKYPTWALALALFRADLISQVHPSQVIAVRGLRQWELALQWNLNFYLKQKCKPLKDAGADGVVQNHVAGQTCRVRQRRGLGAPKTKGLIGLNQAPTHPALEQGRHLYQPYKSCLAGGSQLFSITHFQLSLVRNIIFLHLAETKTFEVQSAHPFWFPNIYIYKHLPRCLTLMKVSSKIPFCNYILYRFFF